MMQLKIPHAEMKMPPDATKTQHSQIKKKKKEMAVLSFPTLIRSASLGLTPPVVSTVVFI